MALSGPSWQVSKWWQRLGFRGEMKSPTVRGDGIQPVVIVGDHQWLTPQTDAAIGIVGFSVNAVPGNYSGAFVMANSPGGLLVEMWHNAGPTTGSMRWSVLDPPSFPAFGAGVQNVNPTRPCVAGASSRVGAANWVGAAGGVTSSECGTAVLTAFPPRGIWCPAGRAFMVECTIVNSAIAGWCYFRELDDPPVSPLDR